MPAKLRQIPAWMDNYIYLVSSGNQAFVVDPTDAGVVLEVLEAEGLELRMVVNTHHHGDHVGGNLELVEATGCGVLGPAHDKARIPGLTEEAVVGQSVEVCGLTMRVLDVRAHTRGHICYALDEPLAEVVRHGHGREPTAIDRLAGRPALFVGDSLFLGGCGRLFEGSPEELHASMTVYRRENPEALVCCAHEYTGSNLRFAASVLPEHGPIAQRLASLDDERAASGSSVPDTLERELATNPFLLYLDDELASAVAGHVGSGLAPGSPQVAGALRSAKDNF